MTTELKIHNLKENILIVKHASENGFARFQEDCGLEMSKQECLEKLEGQLQEQLEIHLNEICQKGCEFTPA